MRKIHQTIVLLLAASFFVWSGCDLFGDDQYCQNEAHESKIWQSGRDVAYSPGDTSVSFVFSRVSKLSERSFKIDNVCPLGVLVVKISVKEKGSILAPHPNGYKALLVEVLPNSGIYKIRKIIPLYRLSDNEISGQSSIDMVDLPENGARNFFVGVAAIFSKGTFTQPLELEDWADANVDQVQFESVYTYWQ